ncbi:MarC family protein [Methylomonas sp. MO1]|uniref:MarC family protein n=1 Tax=Methylomonas sp. MO1 TaxID=3073619 RepID=UPI0028A37500|nr:MarC family protein [Methylomonas sp. MO1]MDT4290267.1 MarC family protein [Methylomonas sp. MO1]
MIVEVDEYIKLLAGLLSVVDPIGAIPLFISLTDHRSSEERRRIACVCALSVGAALLFAHTAGNTWLAFFGISIPSFQIAGGIVIMLMGVSMVKASHDRSRNTPEERAESVDKESIAVVPMAIPLLSGPGAMSTVIVNHNLNPSWNYDVLAVCVIATIALIVLTCLLMAEKIAHLLGRTGMNVITRVFGLIILSIAVEFITKGLGAVFPILVKPLA